MTNEFMQWINHESHMSMILVPSWAIVAQWYWSWWHSGVLVNYHLVLSLHPISRWYVGILKCTSYCLLISHMHEYVTLSLLHVYLSKTSLLCFYRYMTLSYLNTHVWICDTHLHSCLSWINNSFVAACKFTKIVHAWTLTLSYLHGIFSHAKAIII